MWPGNWEGTFPGDWQGAQGEGGTAADVEAPIAEIILEALQGSVTAESVTVEPEPVRSSGSSGGVYSRITYAAKTDYTLKTSVEVKAALAVISVDALEPSIKANASVEVEVSSSEIEFAPGKALARGVVGSKRVVVKARAAVVELKATTALVEENRQCEVRARAAEIMIDAGLGRAKTYNVARRIKEAQMALVYLELVGI